jgi:hypothetical protein
MNVAMTLRGWGVKGVWGVILGDAPASVDCKVEDGEEHAQHGLLRATELHVIVSENRVSATRAAADLVATEGGNAGLDAASA